ncbi:MAG: hypothetical protein IJW67_13360, partial [Blautia sp.]|nr:hypothetical protein [Blautia sp.]
RLYPYPRIPRPPLPQIEMHFNHPSHRMGYPPCATLTSSIIPPSNSPKLSGLQESSSAHFFRKIFPVYPRVSVPSTNPRKIRLKGTIPGKIF